MAGMLDNAIVFLSGLGLLSVVIPFMLAFTVVFALLQKTRILGKESLRYNSVVALVFGFLFVYFVNIGQLLYFALYLVILLMAGIMFMFIVKMVGFKEFKKKERQWILTGIFLFIFVVALNAFIDWEIIRAVLINPATIMLAVFILVLWFVVGRPHKIGKEIEAEQRAQERAEKKTPEQRRPPMPPQMQRPKGQPLPKGGTSAGFYPREQEYEEH